MSVFLSLLAKFSALCIALSVHEWAHAYIAYKQGDSTAKIMGRMTLAPFAHFDLWGFLSLFFLGFGWAKPVPVDLRNFKNVKKSNFLVSIAGVVANLITGTVFIIISCALNTFVPDYAIAWGAYGYCLQLFLSIVIQLNFVLAFFNILPIYPLDGFRIIENFAKPNNAFVNFMRKYSRIILIVLVILLGIAVDYYLSFTAGNLIIWLTNAFNYLFGLMV